MTCWTIHRKMEGEAMSKAIRCHTHFPEDVNKWFCRRYLILISWDDALVNEAEETWSWLWKLLPGLKSSQRRLSTAPVKSIWITYGLWSQALDNDALEKWPLSPHRILFWCISALMKQVIMQHAHISPNPESKCCNHQLQVYTVYIYIYDSALGNCSMKMWR